MREIREEFLDTTCLWLGLAYKKERKCSWLGRKQLENCLRKQKVNERNKKNTLRRNIGEQQGKNNQAMKSSEGP